MARKRNIPSTVPESTVYENFVEQTEHQLDKAPPPPRNAKPDYPKILKVHISEKKDCDAFARLVRRTLRGDKPSFVFTSASTVKPENWKFVDRKVPKPRKSRSSQTRRESLLWSGMVDFKNEEIAHYTFEVTLRSKQQYAAFARLVKQQLSPETKYLWFPRDNDEKPRRHWVSRFADVNPHYPVYIVSKGRADTRLTSRALERIGVPYFIVIEPQDYDAYACLIDKTKILVAPFSNHGDGPGRARNWCWDHSISLGAKRHWVLDDNISAFYRLHENQRIRVADGGIFRMAEEFVDRFENVPLAGFQYRFFVAPRSAYPPFVLNTRIYSCLLIDNACQHRWRGRYNEDTDLSLNVLKDGDCTIQFNAFLQDKMVTQALGGGNTAEFYEEEGTWNKSAMLKAMHPDVTEIVWRYNRWHHDVDYRPFKNNQLKPRHGSIEKQLKDHPMELVISHGK